MIRQCFATLGLCLLPALAQKPAFEVASVKVNTSGRAGGSMGPRGDRFIRTNATLMNLILYAYSPPNGQFLRRQIIGGPEWARLRSSRKETVRYNRASRPSF